MHLASLAPKQEHNITKFYFDSYCKLQELAGCGWMRLDVLPSLMFIWDILKTERKVIERQNWVIIFLDFFNPIRRKNISQYYALQSFLPISVRVENRASANKTVNWLIGASLSSYHEKATVSYVLTNPHPLRS